MESGDVSLGRLEQLVLAAVAFLNRHDEEAYGVSVRKLLEKATKKRPSLGAIYITLERLEKKGLVSTTMGEPTATRGGRRKRLVTIEPLGSQILNEALSIQARLSRNPGAGTLGGEVWQA